ncbi:MAG: methionine synthase, partial [Bacteroidaceae bacterium]|nr:methionine synthase [Bacteroidaceae bacterium]
MIMTLRQAIKQRILILDGAMGTMIQSYNLSEEDFRGKLFENTNRRMKGNNDLLTLTKPQVVSDIHRRYLEAGADIISTNTFSAQTISMSDYGCQQYCDKINRNAVKIARQLADQYSALTPHKPRFVAASIGPTNKTASISPDVNNPSIREITYDQLVEAYKQQMRVVVEEGADALLIETIFDTLNAKAAIFAACEVMEELSCEIPLMLSVTVSDKAGRTLSGQRLDAFIASISHAPVFSVGLNCSFGPREIEPFLKELVSVSPYYISLHPNAGLPDAMGNYDITPQEMQKQMKRFVDQGLVNIIGGCCGTTDQHIALYPALVVNEDNSPKKPHTPCQTDTTLCLSGLELLKATPSVSFFKIGERCNVAGSRKFLKLIAEKNYDQAIEIARRQVEAGAMIIDINMDDGLLDTAREMTTFLNLIASEPDIAKVPVMIDSSRFDVITEALKCLQGKSIVNSISLKEGESVFLDRARQIRRLGAAIMVMAFDEEGQATTYDRKISVCKRAYDLLTQKANIPPCEIIFDPNVLAVATGMEDHDRYALDFIEATRWIKQNLPGARVSGGLSNLSFSFRGNNYLRRAMHTVFLHHAIKAGLDMAIVDPTITVEYSDIPLDLRNLLDDVILYRRTDAAQQLIDLAPSISSPNQKSTPTINTVETPGEPADIDDKICHALIKGDNNAIAGLVVEATEKYPNATDIIQGPLMQGMATVGKRFAKGQMFLPQVVKTARTMKTAVSTLQPLIEKQNISNNAHGSKIMLATVKGDVHDIGKNIVSV